MKNTYIAIIVLILLVLGFLFTSKGNKVEAPTVNVDNINNENVAIVKEFTITGRNFSFSPSLITVQKGDRVKIIFQNSAGFHDFEIDEFGVAAKQAQSPTTEVLEFVADQAGSFEYYCSVGTHRAIGM